MKQFSFIHIKLTKKQQQIALLTGAILLFLLLIFHIVVPIVARHVVEKKVAQMEQERAMSISIDNLHFGRISVFGTFHINIDNVEVKDQDAEIPFLVLHDLHAKVQLWKWFGKTLNLKDLTAAHISINCIKNENECNCKFLNHQNSKKDIDSKVNYQKKLESVFERIDNYTPHTLSVDSILIYTEIDTSKVKYFVADLTIKDGNGSAVAWVQAENKPAEKWQLSCLLNPDESCYEGCMQRVGTKADAVGELPFLKTFRQMDVAFHEARGKLALLNSDKKGLHCELSGSIHHLQCQHHYLADIPVHIDSVGAQLHLAVKPEVVELDSSSVLQLNRATLHPYLRIENHGSKHVIFKINERERDASVLFSSLPADLFQVLSEMKFKGNMDFSCFFDCDFGCLDSLQFDFNLNNCQRSVHISEGVGQITRFNEPFEYTFYDKGEAVRTIIVGPDNPHFCPFEAIPPQVTTAILLSEDPSFFGHRGFIKSSMESALAADLKAGRMRRGGSTLSMQLVKNLLLNRKKVLSRKFEEMLLVWLIEDQRLMSKERMFEIYVNIVEWGPGLLGINEAAEFYFHKAPKDLTLPESLYLATLIRSPKHYASTLNPDGTVNEAKRAELEFDANRLLERGTITETQRAEFDSNVKTVVVL